MREDHVDRFLRELEGLSRDVDPLDLEVEGLVDRVSGISRRIKRALEATLAERGLTHPEWQVLGKLRLGEGHRSSPGDLAAQLELSSGAMTTRLDNLEKAGLVRRERDPEDRRFVTIDLTDKGRRYIAEVFPTVAAAITRELGVLSRDEQAALGALCRKLGRGSAGRQLPAPASAAPQTPREPSSAS